jgi:hypothetical protein
MIVPLVLGNFSYYQVFESRAMTEMVLAKS